MSSFRRPRSAASIRPVGPSRSVACLALVALALGGASLRASASAILPGPSFLPPAGASPVSPLAGPPTLCVPILIGAARSLPWGEGAFDMPPGVRLPQLVEDVPAILRASPDPLVHAETLRRAAVCLMREARDGSGDSAGAGVAPEARPTAVAKRLLARLQSDAEDAERAADVEHAATVGPDTAIPPGSAARPKRDRALAWFDVGYLRAALRQAGLPSPGDGRDEVARAIALRGDDAALRYGAFLVCFDGGGRLAWEHLDKALHLEQDPAGLVRLNVRTAGRHFLQADTDEDLERTLGAKLAAR